MPGGRHKVDFPRPADVLARLSRFARRLGDALGELVARDAVLRERERHIRQRAALLADVQRDHAALAALMGNMSEGLLILDADRRVRYHNAQANRIAGLQPKELIGRPFEEAFAASITYVTNADKVQAQWHEALHVTHDRTRFEVRIERLGSHFDLLVDVFSLTIGGSGEICERGVLLRDVTAERALARTKDEFVSIVSHEIRNPLTSIVGFSELLALGLVAPEKVQDSLQTLHREAQRLHTIVDDLLQLQRIETGRSDYSFGPVELRPVVEQVVSTLSVQATAAHRLEIDVPANLPAVWADREKLTQVVINLVGNAIKYSPSGGEVRIAATREPTLGTNGGAGSGEVVHLSVSDEGLGVPAEALPRIFERFYRVEHDDRKHIGGTGLGLAIVKKIVEAHGGQVMVNSAYGEGSTFTVVLPVTAPEASCARSESHVAHDADAGSFGRFGRFGTYGSYGGHGTYHGDESRGDTGDDEGNETRGDAGDDEGHDMRGGDDRLDTAHEGRLAPEVSSQRS